MKKMHLGLLIAVVVGVVLIGLSKSRSVAPVAAPIAALTVTTTTIEHAPLQRTLTATGSIHAWQELVIASQLGGYRVAFVNVDIGSRVTAGQVLAELDNGLLAAEVQAKRAGLAKSKALENRAAAAHRRGQTLAQQKLLSQADLERLSSEQLAASADTQLAQANLDSAEQNLRYARITAPSAGVIGARSVNLGEITQMGKAMFQLLRDGRIEWRAEVPESQLHQLHVDQIATVHTADGKTLHGKVRSIAPTVDANKRNALVYVDLPEPGSARPGMYARGEFALDNNGANMIPLASVVRNDGYSYVFAVDKDHVVRQLRIETGVIDGDRVEVVSGLAIGQRIVHTGASFLKDGDRVDIAPASPQLSASEKPQ